MSFNSSTANNDTDKAELFNTYFYSVFTPPTDVLSSSGTIYNNQPILDTIDIDEQVVFNNLCALDSTKATGIDDLNPKIYKECALTLLLPICHLFTICMKFAKIPAQWKDHHIIPIYKSGDKTLVNNYRPISLLCILSKVLERIIYNQVVDHIHNLFTIHQFGFLAGRSAVQQLLAYTYSLLEAKRLNTEMDVVYMDFKKAFDSVPHNKLLIKLRSMGIHGRLLSYGFNII